MTSRQTRGVSLIALRRRFKSLRFLLTNSKVPRDTKRLVAGVGQKKLEV